MFRMIKSLLKVLKSHLEKSILELWCNFNEQELAKQKGKCGLNWGICTYEGHSCKWDPEKFVCSGEHSWDEAGSWEVLITSVTHQLVSPPSSLTVQPLNKYWLYFEETNKAKLCPFKPSNKHILKPSFESLSHLLRYFCNFLKEKNLLSQRKAPKTPPPSERPILPFLPSLCSDKPFSQESWSSLVPSNVGCCCSKQWAGSSPGLVKDTCVPLAAPGRGWLNPVLLFYIAQLLGWIACGLKKCQEPGDHGVPTPMKAGKLCFQKAIVIMGQWTFQVPSFPMFL